ncbi:hypothetical protein ASF24_13850 [Methylobacterium sp. Leaf86]|uniref:hypothetical protein n=1 Tax=Methylobacterium sp. Leaf86 TaxID=1736242 RepID=UPI0006FA0D0A|nr:hypothetical protein [Methylobacterium sp. Leaf86]KQO59239.1 hypothetical protein ASF24_13850 [Methylobacterium sp. Leaf86]
MAKTVEGRGAGKRTRPSDVVSRQIDSSEDTTSRLIINRLVHRFGVSVEVAAIVAQLAGLGPQEVRR